MNQKIKSTNEKCKDFIKKTLIKDPKKRITVDEALNHPWFTEYKDYITGIKKKYHPIIDEETGLIVKPSNRRASISLTSDAGKNLASLQ